jgi:glycosyltransferase involved in cell wall biosynthesis
MTHSRCVAAADWRIGLDVAPLRGQPAGVGIYVARLAPALAVELPGRLALLGLREDAVMSGDDMLRLPAEPFRHRHYHAWMQLAAPRASRRMRADLVHFTNAAAPLISRRPFVVTVHDLSVLVMPRAHPRARLLTVPVTLLAIRGARRVIVPSQATADELERVLRVDPARIAVVPHAAPPTGDGAATNGADALSRLGLRPRGYLLALGTIEPRKNHLRLIEAFEELVRRGHDLELVITGAVGWHAEAVLRRMRESPAAGRIRRTDYLSVADLRQLIGSAGAACYVSVYEGYGLPIIEAMALGAPVVTSNVSAMPEAAGGAAVLVDPHDPLDIARGIERAIVERDALLRAGHARAAERTWADVARETIVVYRQALGE